MISIITGNSLKCMENIMEENFTIIELSDNEVKFMEDKLDEYD
ncbi:hypothetical protein [Anaerocolumna jejuensis]